MKKILALTSVLSMAGCSTLMNGTSQEINVTTFTLQNSDIKVESSDTEYVDTLPATLHIYPSDKKLPLTITTLGECVQPNKVTLRKELADYYWLNALNGFGFFVDYATGAMWQYPESAQIEVHSKEYCVDKTASLNK